MITEDIEFALPFPPSVNSYYTHTRNGIFIGKKGVQYRKDSSLCIVEQLGDIDTISEPLHMEVVLYPPDRRKRDLDNYMKCLLDAITHAQLWEDDSQIDQLSIFRGVVIPRSGRVLVSLSSGGPILPA